MSDYRNEYLSQISHSNSHIDYVAWLEKKLEQQRHDTYLVTEQLHELQDVIRYMAIDIGRLTGYSTTKESSEFSNRYLDNADHYQAITHDAIEKSRERAKQ